MFEERKPIPFLPEWKYYVSNLWRVKNATWKIMKVEKNKYWHNRIKLYWAWGKFDVRHYQVHRLVFCVFNNLDYSFWLSDKISESLLVCHKDNNPDNNELSNLYMDTQKENMWQCIKEWRFKFHLVDWKWPNNPRRKAELHVTKPSENGETP